MQNHIRGYKSFLICVMLMTFSLSVNADDHKDIPDISIINTNGGRVDWSHSGNNLIAFDRMGFDGYFDVWTMKPDGSEQRCLTCGISQLPQKHLGNPVWHPSGKFIVFQAQKQRVPKKFDPKCTPGAGALNDLWAMTSNGNRLWRIYSVSPEISKDSQGVLHPQFSHDGKRLIWSQRVRANERAFGEWVIKMANFFIINNTPKLTKIETIRPSETSSFYETHSFSPDDRYFLFTGNQHGGLEIYEYDLLTKKSRRLTQDPKVWDEHAHYTLTGKKIIWMSSTGLPMKINPFQLKTEFWVMDRNAKNKRQLTYFNYPGNPHYMNKEFIVSADSSWSPDGKKLIALLISGEPNSRQRDTGLNVMLAF